MILKSLEMQGFKSFPDKTVLEFGKGITAVVGPNGSGKSNIADAVRWVLGEQSAKNLRGAKLEDVIFGGTSKRKPLGFAEVSLRLENPDAQNENERFTTLTRRYYRSGESEFRMNGEAARLKDAREAFADAGLGRDGYSMISQGSIAELVSPRSTRRRDMLEAAAGIARFRYRRADANRELERAEENLTRLLDILSEIEARVGPLKRQSEKAKSFLVLAEEKKTLEIGLWARSAEESKNALKEDERRIFIAVSQYEAAENALGDLETQIEAAIDEGGKITAKIERLRGEVSEAEEKSAVIGGKIAVEAGAMERNARELERVKREADENDRRASQIDAQIALARESLKKNKAETALKEKKLSEEIKRFAELFEKTGEKSDRTGELNDGMTRAAAKLAEAKVKKAAARSAREKLKAEADDAKKASDAKKEAVKILEREKTEAENELERLKVRTAESRNASDGYKAIMNSLSARAEKLRGERENLTRELYAKNSRIKTLDDLEKNLDGYAGGVRRTIKEAGRGAIKGIRGAVSQLISVSSKYAAAIETALGAAIQNIVVEDEEAAKRAIYFLKDNNAGRATFLPLTSIRSRPFTEKGVESCAGYVATADKLVEYDPEYADIVSYLLGRIVVSEDIDSGTATAKKFSHRFKITTLDGQSLNAGGSMTGGSRLPGAGLLSRAAEIEELKKDAASLEKRLEKKDREIKAVSGELDSARASFEASEAERAGLGEARIKTESSLALTADKLENERTRAAELENAGKSADAAAAREAENEKRADSEILEAEERSRRLERELAETKSEKESVERTREESAKIQNALNLEIVALRKDAEANERETADRLLRGESFKREADALRGEIAEITRGNEEAAAETERLERARAGLKEESARREREIEGLVEKRTEGEAKSVALRAKERETGLEREKLAGEIARLEERRDSARGELEKVRNRLYDEYETTLRRAAEIGAEIKDVARARGTLGELKNKIRALGNVNVGAIEEYKEVSERYEYLKDRLDDVKKSREELTRLVGELTKKMTERFRERFGLINERFGETFRDLFGGGGAELSLDDPRDALECNINITARPPGKTVRNVDLLSGGEKCLAAIALLLAILGVSPAPFCIFDEAEAPLDEANVARYASCVKELSKKAQFILITHRRGTMDQADALYGVAMQEEGVSKLLELKTSELAKKLGVE